MQIIFKIFLVLLLITGAGVPVAVAIEVTDDVGNRVLLEHPAQRIVSLAPHITELLFAAGAGDVVVGVTEFSDYPEAARSIPLVGGGGGLDLEAIVALRPDLVVAWQSGSPAGQVKRLQSLGIAVFMSEPRQLEAVPDTLKRLGHLAGTDAVASLEAQRFRQHHRQLKSRYAQRPAVSVFYQVWEQPLMTINGEHLISDVIRLCGGYNIFSSLPALAPQIDLEAVLAADPDVIVIGVDANNSSVPATWQRWPELSAVSNEHVVVIQRELLVRHSPRILEGADRLCKLLDTVRE